MTPETIRELAFGFQPSRIFLTAYELGVFTAIGEASKTSSQVARRLRTNPRATDRLMNALVAMGLLEKKVGRFSNTPATLRFLVKTHPEFSPGLMHAVNLWKTWNTLTDAVRIGMSLTIGRRAYDGGKNWQEAFIAAMHDRAKKQAPQVVGQMDLIGVKRVLDVGGGPGTFSMAFVRERKGNTATVFDLPSVIPLTKKYIKDAGLADKIDTAAGDYTTDQLPKGYDLVFLSAIVHSNSPAENRRLLKKCAKALNPGGQVVVQDFIMDEDRTSPAHGAFFALNMLVNTERGDTYTESEIVSWMKAAGLSSITRRDNRFGTTQIIGKKM